MSEGEQVEVFLSYSHRDDVLRDELERHLSLLRREGLIRTWHDRRITAGDEWAGKIDARLDSAEVILLLVSSDFLASDYCYDLEMRRALERHEHGEARVIPVVLRPADWHSAPFSKLGALPAEGKPVTAWRDRDQAFADVARGLRAVVASMVNPEAPLANGPQPVSPAGQHDDLVNPFGQTMAIRDPHLFVGRGAELRKLRSLLEHGSVAIVGPPKVGKSSLLWQLKQGWQGTVPLGGSRGGNTVLGPIDLQAFEDPEDLYAEIAELLGVASGNWRALRTELRACSALLLLDELDSGPGRCLDVDHLGRFRAVCNQNPNFKLVTVTRDAVKASFPDERPGSAAYSFLQPMLLDLLSDTDARRLLAHPWVPEARPFDAVAVEEILTVAGRHPFKLQRGAYHRFQAFAESGYEWRGAWRQDMEHML